VVADTPLMVKWKALMTVLGLQLAVGADED
jgi:hypothetical protein